MKRNYTNKQLHELITKHYLRHREHFSCILERQEPKLTEDDILELKRILKIRSQRNDSYFLNNRNKYLERALSSKISARITAEYKSKFLDNRDNLFDRITKDIDKNFDIHYCRYVSYNDYNGYTLYFPFTRKLEVIGGVLTIIGKKIGNHLYKCHYIDNNRHKPKIIEGYIYRGYHFAETQKKLVTCEFVNQIKKEFLISVKELIKTLDVKSKKAILKRLNTILERFEKLKSKYKTLNDLKKQNEVFFNEANLNVRSHIFNLCDEILTNSFKTLPIASDWHIANVVYSQDRKRSELCLDILKKRLHKLEAIKKEWFCFNDSIKVGNCSVGSTAFIANVIVPYFEKEGYGKVDVENIKHNVYFHRTLVSEWAKTNYASYNLNRMLFGN